MIPAFSAPSASAEGVFPFFNETLPFRSAFITIFAMLTNILLAKKINL